MKYHIFIGSTLDDLKNERKELPRIVMELGHIPVMADYLDDTARNSQNLLQKVIEECDYFIALAANKYSAADGKILPVIAQCSIAAQKGIPVLALVIDEKARSTQAKREQDPELINKLDNFKAKLREGPCETWLNTPDLCQKAQSLLVQELNINARPGWVRAEKLIDPIVANEISRLSSENDTMRRRIKIMDDGELVNRLRDQLKHAIKVLALNKVTLSFYYASGDNWENSRQFRYLRIFKLLVPELALGKNTAEISRFLGTVLNPNLDKMVRKDYPTPSNTIKKIMADFSMLKLVRCTNDEEAADKEIWEITEYGKELYSAYRMRQLEKALIKKP
jgi:hypothetical protein